MEDMKIDIYHERSNYFSGEIKGGSLHLTSEVWGDDYESEQHIDFTKEQTEQLFSLITLEGFVNLCRKERLKGMWKFLEKHGIRPASATI